MDDSLSHCNGEVYPVRVFIPEEGKELSASNGQQYRLTARLGGGRYSEVWKAEVIGQPGQSVAVKIMVPGLDDEARRLFVREAYVLKMLAQAQRTLGLSLDNGPLVPIVEAIADNHDPPFFVESLAPGKPLDQILREQSLGKTGGLSEADGLTIGEQLCRVFQVLHEKLERSYLDFQPRNVFWDAETRHITVVDWNLLSPVGQADVTGDLDAVARLLYRLLVGESLPSQGPHYGARWASLTSGTQAVLTQALHGNPARRYSGMAAMRRDLAQQIAWWGQEPGALVQEAAERLERVKHGKHILDIELATDRRPAQQVEAEYQSVQQVLDIAGRKGADESLLGQLREKTAAGLMESSALGRGKAFYGASDYTSAQEAFDEARKRAATLPEVLAAWRWYLAAQAACEIGSQFAPHRDVVARLIETLSDWTEAEWTGREPDTPEIPAEPDLAKTASESLQRLEGEFRAWALLREARQSELQDAPGYWAAAKAYRGAKEQARSLLPYSDDLLFLWGEVGRLAQDLEAQADDLQKSQEWHQRLEDAFGQDVGKGCRVLGEALSERPGDEGLTGLALDRARKLLEQGCPDVAKVCLDNMVRDAAPRYLGEVHTVRQAVLEQLEWQYRLDRIAVMIEEHRGSESVSAFSTLDIEDLTEELVMLAAGNEQADSEKMKETVKQMLRKHLRDASQEVLWRQALDTILCIVRQTPEGMPLRRRAWDLAARVLSSPTFPEWYQPLFHRQLADCLAPSETEQKALLDDLREARTRREQTLKKRKVEEQIESHRQAAKHMAARDLISGEERRLQGLEKTVAMAWEQEDEVLAARCEEEYLQELEKILARAREQGDKVLAARLEKRMQKYKTACQSAEEKRLRDQVELHRRQAEQLQSFGLLSRLPGVLEQLDQALMLARQLQDKALIETLAELRRECIWRQEKAAELTNDVKRLVKSQDWRWAIDLLKKMRDDLGITGQDSAGEIENWLTDLAFKQKASDFEKAYEQWEKTNSQLQRRELVKQMCSALREMRKLANQLDEPTQSRLGEINKRYLDCYDQTWRTVQTRRNVDPL